MTFGSEIYSGILRETAAVVSPAMGEGDRVTGPSRKTQPSPVTALSEHTLSCILVDSQGSHRLLNIHTVTSVPT